MEQQIINMVTEIIFALLGLGGLWLIGFVKSYLAEKKISEQNHTLGLMIDSLVQAAEQMLKGDDPTGVKRKQFVVRKLEEMGYLLTNKVNAMIESKVFELNKEEKRSENH